MATSALYSTVTSDVSEPAASMAAVSKRGSARMVPARLSSCRSSSSLSEAPSPMLHSAPIPAHRARMPVCSEGRELQQGELWQG